MWRLLPGGKAAEASIWPLIFIYCLGKVKGIVLPRTGHEDPESE
jgi:hypothetical protein